MVVVEAMNRSIGVHGDTDRNGKQSSNKVVERTVFEQPIMHRVVNQNEQSVL